MKPRIIPLLIVFGLVASSFSLTPSDKEVSKIDRKIPFSGEKKLYVSMKVSTGYLFIQKNEGEDLFSGEFLFEKESPDVNYEKLGDDGRLTIRFYDRWKKSKEEESSRITSIDELFDNECTLKFSPRIPIGMDLEFGVFKGDLDLTDLKIESLRMEAGVCKGTVEFNKPNRVLLETLGVEAGVGKLVMTGLGNANFEELSFDGGLGSYELYFDGDLKQSASVDINMGMGKLNLYLPRSVGVRLKVNKSFLSSLSIDEIYKKHNYYFNENWGKTAASLDINIDTGLGKINVEWLDE